MVRLWLAIALIGGLALNAAAPRTVFANGMEGESTDKKRIRAHGASGGGGAGAPLNKSKPLNKPKQKMLNPQPEPPGRR